ncbi:MAG: hypothetical protein F4088_00220 [Chloroflexi bacterium]|nr:hypothetical protein [Chloroflexota bacterium]
MTEEGLQLFHALDHADRYIAGALPIEVRRPQASDLVEQSLPEGELHLEGRAIGNLLLRIKEQ